MASMENYEALIAKATVLADEAVNSGKSDTQCAKFASMARMYFAAALVEHAVAVAEKQAKEITGWGRRIAMCERMLRIREGEQQMPDPFAAEDDA